MRESDTKEWRTGEYTASERIRHNPSGRIGTYVRASDKGFPSLYLFPDECFTLCGYGRNDPSYWSEPI